MCVWGGEGGKGGLGCLGCNEVSSQFVIAFTVSSAPAASTTFATPGILRSTTILLFCQPNVTVTSCFVYIVIMDFIIDRSLVH